MRLLLLFFTFSFLGSFSFAADVAPLPQKRPVPSAEQLREIYYKLKDRKPEANPPKIVTLSDDWRTKGNWIDRYGTYAGVLCAQAGGGLDYFAGYQIHNVRFAGWIGRNYKEKDDVLRRWVHWLESNDQRVSQCEALGGRKQAEWDDHKEVYPATLDGPHIYGTFTLPEGKYIMSLYFFNKDGHRGSNRCRDYFITVKTAKVPKNILENLGRAGTETEELFLNTKGGAASRVKDFWGGVWKRFYVEVGKEESVMVKIDANYSFNTIVSAVMFDPAVSMDLMPPGSIEPPPPAPRKETDWAMELDNIHEDVWRRVNVLDRMLLLRDSDPAWYHTNSRENLLPLFRAFVTIKDGLPYAPDIFDTKTKERFRTDTGTLAGDLQLFDIRDKIDFSRGGQKRDLLSWLEMTKMGRERVVKELRHVKIDAYENWLKYCRFLEAGKSKHTW